jgi:hypothetical protein
MNQTHPCTPGKDKGLPSGRARVISSEQERSKTIAVMRKWLEGHKSEMPL